MLSHCNVKLPPPSLLRLALRQALQYRERYEYQKIRREMKEFGQRLAQSRVMKLKEDDPERVGRIMNLAAQGWEFSARSHIQKTFMPNVLDFFSKMDRRALISTDWKPAPWAEESWFFDSPYYLLHGLHMSEKTPGNVAFAENLAKGNADRFTSVKPGRYLTKFFGGVLSEGEIRRWAERCAASALPVELDFIESNDPEGWLRVYRDGPSSCMQGEDCVRIYAHAKSVLRLAYISQGETIVGRAIVRDDRKEYIRVYPNTDSRENQHLHDRLKTMLIDRGYTEGTLEGVLLEADDLGDGEYTMPYLDHGAGDRPRVTLVTVHGRQYFRVSQRGEHDADNTCGSISIQSRVECAACGDRYDPDDLTYVEGHGDICNGCLENDFVLAIARYGHEYMPVEDAIYCETNGNYYTEEGAQRHDIHQCEESGNWYVLDELTSTSRGLIYCQHDTLVSLDEPDDEGNEYAHRNDTEQTHDGRTIHEDCAVDRGGRICHVNDPIEETETETQGE